MFEKSRHACLFFRVKKSRTAPAYGFREVAAPVRERRDGVFGRRYAELVGDRKQPRAAPEVAPCEEQPVAGQAVAPQGALLARGRALLVEYRAAGIVDDAPALFADAYRPVQLLVIEEVDLRHRSGFFERFAPDHHRRAVRIGRVVRGVVPTRRRVSPKPIRALRSVMRVRGV